jgi:hypothetical protein
MEDICSIARVVGSVTLPSQLRHSSGNPAEPDGMSKLEHMIEGYGRSVARSISANSTVALAMRRRANRLDLPLRSQRLVAMPF